MRCVIQNTQNEEKQFIGAVNGKKACVWMGFSGAITHISTSNMASFFMHMQLDQLTR
jgi:hypothetical protein